MLLTSLIEVRFCGQLQSTLVFLGSGFSWLPSTMIPRYVMLDCLKVHLVGQRKYDSSSSRSKTLWVICQCLSKSFPVAMSMSST
jgi:hypothetical protein